MENNSIETSPEKNTLLCLECSELLSKEAFGTSDPDCLCIKYMRENRRIQAQKAKEAEAYNSLRTRARIDMRTFGKKNIVFSQSDMKKLFTDDQIQNYTKYALVPRRPDEVLSVDNAVVVETHQRQYVVARWRRAHDARQFEKDLGFICSCDSQY